MQLNEATARRRFGSVPVVRLATVDALGRPHLVVTTFVVDGDHIYLAVDQKPKTSRELKRVRNIRANPEVAALADHYDDDWRRLWWVRADGSARITTDANLMAGPIELLTARYPQYRSDPPRGPVIAITVTAWSGWAYTEPDRP
ncbi:MAG TPA: TIGR03668 family PPOX class F420-dependent oxidoreductase [Actinomycetes bacterium]|nr:TIGR03668 family PPOX class F420-dependent oxidoreductase [Actinomycetes bacterium]